MPLQRFVDALNSVPYEYFGNTERLFTYELYYQLRIMIQNNPFDENNIVLDAELPKRLLSQQQAQALGLLPLNGLMSPDFIIHERENGNNQLLVSEVKAERYLNQEKTIKDINKLISLRHNYNFQNGVFVAININMQKIRDYIHNLNPNPLPTDLQIMWPNNIDHSLVNIDIYTKEYYHSPWEHNTLLEIINNP